MKDRFYQFMESGMARHAMIEATAVAVILSLGVASKAAEVTYPKDKPEIAMEIPGDWKVEQTPIGVEISAPEKNSVIVASVLDKDRARVEAWSKKALEKMRAFGIAFDDKAKVPPPSQAAKSQSTKSVAAISNTPDFAKDGAFTFSGPPTLASPGETASDPSHLLENSVESLTDPATRVSTKPKFRVVQYAGTTLNGKAVDVQFAIYDLPNKRLFLVMQESGPDDTRAVQIAKSVRSVK